ncbi:MAG TPA: 4a-hydroxytetrahydrobiopterin dehydratase [bacterium]|nr:4a-hydroxytetrahydrobiopterin dehydratase [bacterium]
MTDRRLLSEDERRAALAELPGWELREGRLCRSFRFTGFVEAFGFMTQVARVAERLNHHPDWSNAYNRVEIALTTHDLGGLSTLDVELARRIAELAG